MGHFASPMWEVPDGLVKTVSLLNPAAYLSNAEDVTSSVLGTYSAEREGFVRVTSFVDLLVDGNTDSNVYNVKIEISYTNPAGTACTSVICSSVSNITLQSGADGNNMYALSGAGVVYVKKGTDVTSTLTATTTLRNNDYDMDGAYYETTSFEYDR